MEKLLIGLYLPEYDDDQATFQLLQKWTEIFRNNKTSVIDPELWRIHKHFEIALDYQVLLDFALPDSPDFSLYPQYSLNLLASALHLILIQRYFEKFNIQDDFSRLISILEFNGLLHILPITSIQPQLLKILLYNVPVHHFDLLRSNRVGCLASISGQVQRISTPRTMITSKLLKCHSCNCYFFQSSSKTSLELPARCISATCDATKFEVVQKHSKISTQQSIRIQESYSDLLDKPSTSIDIELTGSMAGNCMPGNLVTVVGILKTSNVRDKIKKSRSRTLFDIYLQALSITAVSTGLAHVENPDANITSFIRDLEINEPFRYYLIASSLCGNIVGLPYVKAGLLLSLIGGTQAVDQKQRIIKRGNIHCLLIGDPGVGKSGFLKGISKIAENGRYLSGGSITPSGLTASLSKESDSSEFVLEFGALILGDGGIVAIDELDKMGVKYQDILLESMEQQSVSISKGGIVCTLSARCTLICASNPKLGNESNLTDNISMSSPLLNRFDLVFLINNLQVSSSILGISNNILSEIKCNNVGERILYFEDADHVPTHLVKAYIKYTKSLPEPKFTKSSAFLVKEYYKKMKRISAIAVTIRQLESLIRLSHARAKCDFSEVISDEHVKDVIEIMNKTAYNERGDNKIKFKHRKGSFRSFVDSIRDFGKEICSCEEVEGIAIKSLESSKRNTSVDSLIERANFNGFIIKVPNGWRVINS